MNATLSSLSNRSALGWLRERDIDLLVCSELHANGALTRWFANKVLGGGPAFGGAWVSHAEADGESDLLVVLEQRRQKIMILIENKIAATFQPEQAVRYVRRAERLANEEGGRPRDYGPYGS